MDKENKGLMKRLSGKIRNLFEGKKTDETREQKITESERDKLREAVKEERVSIEMSNVSSSDIDPKISQELADIENRIKNLGTSLSQAEEELKQKSEKVEQQFSSLKDILRQLEQQGKELKENKSKIESIISLRENLEKMSKELYESFERVKGNAINLGNRIEQFNKSIEVYKKEIEKYKEEIEAKKENLAIIKREEERKLKEKEENLRGLISKYKPEIDKIMKEVQEMRNKIKKGVAYLLAQKILLMVEKYGKEDFNELSFQDKEKVCIEIKKMYNFRKDHISLEEKILREAAQLEDDGKIKKLYEKAADVLREINNAYACVFEEKTDKTQ